MRIDIEQITEWLGKHARVVCLVLMAACVTGAILAAWQALADHESREYLSIVEEVGPTLPLVHCVGVLVFAACFGAACVLLFLTKTLRASVFLYGLVMTVSLNAMSAVLFLSYRQQVTHELRWTLERIVTHVYFNDDKRTEAWDYIQMKLTCCGAIEYREYKKTSAFDHEKSALPWSCCTMGTTDMGRSMPINVRQCQMDAKRDLQDSVFINMKGCYEPLLIWAKNYLFSLTFTAVWISVIQIAIVVLIYWQSYRFVASSSGYRKIVNITDCFDVHGKRKSDT